MTGESDTVHVLLVDDEPNILSATRRMLRRAGGKLETTICVGADAALAELDSTSFDVVVSDMRMPGMDGAQFLRNVRDQQPEAMRIVLSGQTSNDAAYRAVSVAHQFLSKPCESATLLDVIWVAGILSSSLNRDLRRVLGRLGSLLSLRSATNEFHTVLTRDDATIDDVCSIILRDPGMTAKVLQLVSSSFFGVTGSTPTVRGAVSLIGLDVLRRLASDDGLFRAAEDDEQLTRLIDGICLTYRCAKETSPKCSATGHPGDAEHLVSALGWLALAELRPEEVAALILNTTPPEDRSTETDEEAIFGASHRAVGHYLAALWGLSARWRDPEPDPDGGGNH